MFGARYGAVDRPGFPFCKALADRTLQNVICCTNRFRSGVIFEISRRSQMESETCCFEACFFVPVIGKLRAGGR